MTLFDRYIKGVRFLLPTPFTIAIALTLFTMVFAFFWQWENTTQNIDGYGSKLSLILEYWNDGLWNTNGLAFAKNGDILIANFGTDRLELMKQTGETEVLYDSLNGKPIGKVNFVIRDSKDRIWITVSTLLPNWMESASSIKRDGFVALADEKGLRIVADGFAFTNEIRLDEKEEWLYIVETTGMKITRMRVLDNGDLVDRETYGPENHGAFIDGIAFDSKGNLWGTHIMTDHIFAILPDGDLTIILDDDNNSIPGKNLLEAFKEGKATPELMMECGGKIAPWMASITFGGRDLQTVYIGSLRGTNIPFFRSPISGLPLIHW